MDKKQKVIIVGGGHAGANVAYNLRKDGFLGNISILSQERHFPYHRPPLSKDFFKSKIAEDKLFFKPSSFYQQNDISVQTDIKVDSINRAEKTITGNFGVLDYSYLVLATGASPRILNEALGDNIFYLRALDDVKQITNSLSVNSKVCLIGGGYIGLELAASLKEMDMNPIIIEAEDRLLKRVTSEEVSSFYKEFHASKGVDIRCSSRVVEYKKIDNRVVVCVIDSGDEIEVDAVIVGIGAVPNIGLAEKAGLTCNNGIYVDAYCRSEDPFILAAGDCTQHVNQFYNHSMRLESVPNALAQAKVVSSSIIGGDMTYNELPWFWSDQFELKLQMAGISSGYDESFIVGNKREAQFLSYYGKNGSLIAVDSVNSPKEFMAIKRALSNRYSISMETIRDPNFKPENLFSGSA
ncbi:MAG: FAD-dependent oxidoreductase [Gammaproteobacteria bacterium]